MKRSLCLLALVTWASATPALAQYGDRHSYQYWGGGFLSVGRGGSNSELLDPKLAVAGGYEAHFGGRSGPQFGVRASGGYARFDPDVEAYVDSVGAQSGSRRGGETTVYDTGADGLLGWRFGNLAVYGYWGLHYFRDTHREMTLSTDAGDYEFTFRRRTDFGETKGYGVALLTSGGQGLYAEWFSGGGYDERMIRQEGVRFGFLWGW
ncbi:MAG TPA: hypothetical protein VFX98_03265 [Longimicrobiaceae bacterium]|nr:hypothetical protein [Longimicrobiaceae bacterium]